MNESYSLKKHQALMLEMLKEADRICKKHNIRYSLFAGTALGAVRHKGFIPWDDDLDIIMTRSEYAKFLACAEAEIDNKKFFLQKEYSEHWPIYYSKLRLNNTTCFECFYPKDEEMHQGIFIDIFPCDNLSDNKYVQKIQFIASKIIIAKSLHKRGYIAQGMKKKLFMQFCRLIPAGIFLKITQHKYSRSTDKVHSFLAASSKFEKSIYKREWFEDTVLMDFEDSEFPVSAHYDELLKVLYGDYMTLPPEEDRKCKVHGVFVDLEKPYTEHLDMQKTMKIETLSRSIR